MAGEAALVVNPDNDLLCHYICLTAKIEIQSALPQGRG